MHLNYVQLRINTEEIWNRELRRREVSSVNKYRDYSLLEWITYPEADIWS